MKRLEFLDSLRGIAALAVIVLHMPLILIPQLPIPEIVRPMVMYGWSGVQLFFVISAFSLCLTMPRHKEYGQPIISYTIARFFRIAPLFYILILYNIVSMIIKSGVAPNPLDIVLGVTFTFNLLPSHSWGMVGAGWTIGVEMLFYVIFPFLYFQFPSTLQRISLVFLTMTVFMVFVAMVLPYISDSKIRNEYNHISFFDHLPTFIMGMVAFNIYSILINNKFKSQIGFTLLSIGIFVISILIKNQDNPLVVDTHQAAGFAFALILVGLGLYPLRIVVGRVTQFYGRISYSTYLWHAPVIFLLEPTLHQVYRFNLGEGMSLIICYAIVFAAVTVVAELSYFFIELPGMRLGKHIKAKIVSAPLPQAQPTHASSA